MDQRISLVTLAVADVAVARRFYADGLRWTPKFENPSVVMFQVGEFVLLSLWAESEFEAEVGSIRRGDGAPPMTLAHNVSSQAEVDGVLEAARRAGAPMATSARARAWGGYSGYFADPDGFRWEVACAPADDEIVGSLVPPAAPEIGREDSFAPAEPAAGPAPEPGPLTVEFTLAFPVDDAELSALHARAFSSPASKITPWQERLERHSLTWVGAFQHGRLVGFVHAVWDGAAHAFLLDLAVDPDLRRRGLGTALVTRLTAAVRDAGCTWLHVDYEEHLDSFYRSCGFSPTAAGLIKLR